VADAAGRPLPGRELVRALWRQGYAVSSGSACRSAAAFRGGASAVLLAMGYGEEEAASGLRLSLGPWVSAAAVQGFAAALERARRSPHEG
jgi:cysteine desulfurase